ncbi:hypothetical protein SNEBB_003411 [Seison nebaliae]|nr:hypothetical protein SNEBB_003411 [Seison nebaliae]
MSKAMEASAPPMMNPEQNSYQQGSPSPPPYNDVYQNKPQDMHFQPPQPLQNQYQQQGYPQAPVNPTVYPPGVGGPPVVQIQGVPTGPIVIPPLGTRPVGMICPNCRNSIRTKTDSETSVLTWVACILLTPFSLCCIPFCIDALKRTVHSCPTCRHTIGVKDF